MSVTSRFPLVYCPKGVARPTWFPLGEAHALALGAGPDAHQVDDHVVGGDGVCYNGTLRAGTWRKAEAGWYLLDEGAMPNHLIRLDPPRAVLRWSTVTGIAPEHRWQVPVLLTSQIDDEAVRWSSALDQVLGSQGWAPPAAFAAIQETLMALVTDRLAGDQEALLTRTALELLTFGQHGDRDLWQLLGWISETLICRVLMAACDREASA